MEQRVSDDYSRYLADAQPLSRDELVDKIKGCIYGQALGDAIGIRTEFQSADEAADA